MEVLHARCAGFDVHKKMVRVCLLIRQENGTLQREFRTYATTTQDLLNLLDWLLSQGCSHVALEGTGVYTLPTMLPKRCSTGSTLGRSCIVTFVPV